MAPPRHGRALYTRSHPTVEDALTRSPLQAVSTSDPSICTMGLSTLSWMSPGEVLRAVLAGGRTKPGYSGSSNRYNAVPSSGRLLRACKPSVDSKD